MKMAFYRGVGPENEKETRYSRNYTLSLFAIRSTASTPSQKYNCKNTVQCSNPRNLVRQKGLEPPTLRTGI